MDRTGFWALIDRARTAADNPTTDELEETVAAELDRLEPAEIESYDEHVAALLTESYRWDLWGAAYVMCGGCSDDGFDYFLAWLIAQGEKVYTNALASPDSLAEVEIGEDEFPEFEMFWYLADKAYEKKTGIEEVPQHPIDRSDLGDDDWDFDDEDEMAARYPKLWAKYGEDPL